MIIQQDKAAEIQRLLQKLATSGTYESVAITNEIKNVAAEAAKPRLDEEVIEYAKIGAFLHEENAKLKKLLDMSVNEIDLSVRAANYLSNASIFTVGDLAQKTEDELLNRHNVNRKSIKK